MNYQNKTPENLHGSKSYVFFVSFVAALGGFLFGYDLVIISGAIILLKKYFAFTVWQEGFAMSSAIFGCLAGPIIAGRMCDWMGRKKTLIFAGILFALSAVGTALPKTALIFYIFRIIGGIGVGIASVASPMYIVEIAPPKNRGALGIMYQLAIAIGAMASFIVAFLLARTLPDETSWRWMFASVIVPIIFFVIFLLMVPDSPRWLVEKQRSKEALAILAKINGHLEASKILREIQDSITKETGRLSDLFKPGIRKALLIGIILSFLNNWTGWTMIGMYQATIFQKAGFGAAGETQSAAKALFPVLFTSSWAVILTLVAIWLVDRVGRKVLWNVGSAMMIIFITLMGLYFYFDGKGVKINPWFAVIAVMLCATPHAFALGPLPWLMVSELFPTKIRARAVAICTFCIWIAGSFVTLVFPKISEWSEKTIGSIAISFWIFTGSCVLSLIFGLTMLPETKGRTLEEIGDSWSKKMIGH